MMTPLTSDIAAATPDHLKPLSDQARAAERILAHRRKVGWRDLARQVFGVLQRRGPVSAPAGTRG